MESAQAANEWIAVGVVNVALQDLTPGASHDTFSRNTRLQLRQLLEAVRELTTPPEPTKRPIGFVHPKDSKDAAGKAAAKGKKV